MVIGLQLYLIFSLIGTLRRSWRCLPTLFHELQVWDYLLWIKFIVTGGGDEDITPSDTIIDYKVSSFLYLHNDKTKNWLIPNISFSNVLRNNDDDDREWICHEKDQSQSTIPSKLNFQFVGGPIVLHWEDHNSFIWNGFEAHEHLMEILFDKLLNGCGLTSRTRLQGLQIITTSCMPLLLSKVVLLSWA
jgi:hypothetical protein